jgi:hypothetical protein
MMAVYIAGVGLLAPGLIGWQASTRVLLGEQPYHEEKLPRLHSDLLPPNERRRTTQTIKLVLQVAEEAITESGLAASQASSVLASSNGDCEIIDKLCRVLALPDRPLSPTHFHNSVHNAPGGYWTIATACQRPSVSISAHDHSFSAGLLEAATFAVVERSPVLLVAYEYPAPFPLSPARFTGAPFAVALLLTPERTVQSWLRLTLACTREAIEDQLKDKLLEALRTTNPAARSLPLLQTLAQKAADRVVLPYLDGQLAVACEPIPGLL